MVVKKLSTLKLATLMLPPGSGGTPPMGGLPEFSLVNNGYQLLTELRYDQLDPILDVLRRDLLALGIPLISLEVELGPSQVELTARIGPRTGIPPLPAE